MQKNIKKYWPIFTLPTMIAFTIGFIVPFILGIYLSFTKFTTVKDAKWVGLKNYITAFKDTTFDHSFWFTAAFALVTLVLINVIAFALAMALTKSRKGTNVFRTIFFMPNLIGGIVLGYIWQLIFSGILVHFNTALNLNAKLGFWGLVILVCWQQIGYMMIIYVAGIQNISPDLIEAAKIDGANGRELLRYVILPMLRPTITICSFLTLTNGFKLFDQNLALTGGNPGKLSQLLALNIYDTMYGTTGWQGVGQAKAVIFFILVAVIALVQNKLTTRKEVEA